MHQRMVVLFLTLAPMLTPFRIAAQDLPPMPPAPPAVLEPQQGQWLPEGLTQEQREAIREIRLQTQAKMSPLHNQLQEKRARLRTVSSGSTLNRKEALAVIDDISKIEAEIAKLRWDSREKVRGTLTEEQRIVFDARMARGTMAPQRGRGAVRPQGQRPGHPGGHYDVRRGGPGQGPAKGAGHRTDSARGPRG